MIPDAVLFFGGAILGAVAFAIVHGRAQVRTVERLLADPTPSRDAATRDYVNDHRHGLNLRFGLMAGDRVTVTVIGERVCATVLNPFTALGNVSVKLDHRIYVNGHHLREVVRSPGDVRRVDRPNPTRVVDESADPGPVDKTDPSYIPRRRFGLFG